MMLRSEGDNRSKVKAIIVQGYAILSDREYEGTSLRCKDAIDLVGPREGDVEYPQP